MSKDQLQYLRTHIEWDMEKHDWAEKSRRRFWDLENSCQKQIKYVKQVEPILNIQNQEG